MQDTFNRLDASARRLRLRARALPACRRPLHRRGRSRCRLRRGRTRRRARAGRRATSCATSSSGCRRSSREPASSCRSRCRSTTTRRKAWAQLRDALQSKLDDPGVATSEIDIEPVGRHTVAAAIEQFVTGDIVVHTWDLAKAAGLDATIDHDMATRMLRPMTDDGRHARGERPLQAGGAGTRRRQRRGQADRVHRPRPGLDPLTDGDVRARARRRRPGVVLAPTGARARGGVTSRSRSSCRQPIRAPAGGVRRRV